MPRSSHRFRLVELARREHANRVSEPSARSTIVEGTESLSSSRTVSPKRSGTARLNASALSESIIDFSQSRHAQDYHACCEYDGDR